MYKRTIRAFALGILFSASLIGAMYYYEKQKNTPSLEEAKRQVEEAGYIILSEKEYEELSQTSIIKEK